MIVCAGWLVRNIKENQDNFCSSRLALIHLPLCLCGDWPHWYEEQITYYLPVDILCDFDCLLSCIIRQCSVGAYFLCSHLSWHQHWQFHIQIYLYTVKKIGKEGQNGHQKVKIKCVKKDWLFFTNKIGHKQTSMRFSLSAWWTEKRPLVHGTFLKFNSLWDK
jgi:hypothetical protein